MMLMRVRSAVACAIVLMTLPAVLAGCQQRVPTPALYERGQREFEREQYEAASATYSEIVSRYPGDWEAQYRLGLVSLELDRLQAARIALEVAITENANNPDIADALAETLFRQNDERRLFAFLRERAERTQTARAYLRLGRYAMELGDPDSAKSAIDTAIELDSGRTTEPYLQAVALAERTGNLDLALRRLRQAYGINPDDPRVRDQLVRMGEVPGPSLALPPGR